ncbi:porin [Paraburkholderia bannensis]|uniref:porin n=1 Tax=Paraburkholderia bannensis TaxID=765414 RepID=UPI002AB65E68|nr:porin [Paraburkholderia bannensis]
MKKALLAAAIAVPAVGYAQSSVSLYGIVDEGVTYTNSQAGHSNVQMSSGNIQGSRWGLKGQEDLGGGLAAVFNLENGYDVGTGKLGQGGRMFGRKAYVGISSPYGTVTLGRQYESTVDFITPYVSNEIWGGGLFIHANDMDLTDGTVRVDNSMKFKSVDYAGFNFGGLYSFGGQPGAFGKNSVWSAGASYTHDWFSAGASYLHINSPSTAVLQTFANSPTYTNVIYGSYLAAARSEDVLAAGTSLKFGAAQVLLSYTDTVYHGGAEGHDVRFANYETSFGYYFTPTVFGAATYNFTDGINHANDQTPRYHLFGLMGDYFLSKRTDLYAQVAAQLATSDAHYAQIGGLTASSTNRQVVARIGIRHKF